MWLWWSGSLDRRAACAAESGGERWTPSRPAPGNMRSGGGTRTHNLRSDFAPISLPGETQEPQFRAHEHVRHVGLHVSHQPTRCVPICVPCVRFTTRHRECITRAEEARRSVQPAQARKPVRTVIPLTLNCSKLVGVDLVRPESVFRLRVSRRSSAVSASLHQTRRHPDRLPGLGVHLDSRREPPIATRAQHHQLFCRHVRRPYSAVK